MRPATRSPGICASTLRISSVMPSAKNSFSGSALMLANGSTAIDFCGAVREVTESGCASAATRSRAVWNRSAASRASDRATTPATARDTSSRIAETCAGVFQKRIAITACAVGPTNACSPVSISKSTQPSE